MRHLAIHNPVQVRGDSAQRAEQARERRRPANEQERIEKIRGMPRPIDEGAGQILQTLHRHGIDQNPLMLFFADTLPPQIQARSSLSDLEK